MTKAVYKKLTALKRDEYMSPEETQFLLKMDEIVRLQEELPKRIAEERKSHLYDLAINRLQRAKVKRSRGLRAIDLQEKSLGFDSEVRITEWQHKHVEACKQFLMNAGQILGMNARWEVKIEGEDQLRMYPKNGAAQRLWARYELLYMERELSRD